MRSPTTSDPSVTDPSVPTGDARPARRPRRSRVLLVGLAGLSLVALLAACSPEQDHIRDLVNYTRVAQGRSVLVQDSGLDDKATYVARSIAAARALTHSNLADGAPAGWHELGENIGYGGSIDTVEGAFMASTEHRANILDPVFNHIGTGYATGLCPSSGATCTYVVQEFGQY